MSEINSYFATYGRGSLEFITKELNEFNKNSTEIIKIQDSSVEGKILFQTNLKPTILIEKLKIIERLFISMHFEKLDHTQSSQNLDELFNKISFKNFKSYHNVLDLERCQEKDEDCPVNKKSRLAVKYRINTKITGKLRQRIPYNQNITKKLVEKFEQENLKNFEYDSNNPDLEVCLHISDVCIAFGIQLTHKPISTRSYIKHVGLRSTVCAIMLQLADLKNRKNSLVYDPFCGYSTIFTEYLGNHSNTAAKYFHFIMSDASDDQLNYSKANLNNITTNKSSDLFKFNLNLNAKFPLIDNSVDVIITDLPFGKKHTRGQNIDNNNELLIKFYQSVVIEFKRILNVHNGIAVVLVNSNETNTFENAFKQTSSVCEHFEICSKHAISLGETNATVYKLIASS